MTPITLEVEQLQVTSLFRSRGLGLQVRMTDQQVQEAVYRLLGTLPEEQACRFLQSEFPQMFPEEVSP
jgi:hypothetical protein